MRYFNKNLPISIGDKLGGMKIVKIEPYSKESEIPFGPNNIKVLLKGPITVSGEYDPAEPSPDIPWWENCVGIFKLDKASVSLLPQLPWFKSEGLNGVCFNNQDFAKSILGEKKKMVTIKIDNYELNDYPSNVQNVVDFVEVANE